MYRLENRNHSKEILKSIRKTLHNMTLYNDNVRILSGGEEGAGGWITTNYLGKTLKKHYVSFPYIYLGSTFPLVK